MNGQRPNPQRPLRTIHERFCEFNQNHPEVYWKFREFALEAKKAGLKTYSARAIIERIRWFFYIEQDSNEQFKLNDHFGPHYARLLVQAEPQLFDGFFKFRSLRRP